MVNDTTTIKVTKSVKQQLDSYRFEKEAYNTVIQRLLNENEELRKDKNNLLKIAVNSNNVNTFPDIRRTIKYTILSIISDDNLTDNEKLNCFRVLLKPELETDTSTVLAGISEIENNFTVNGTVLEELKIWISENYQ